MEQAGAGASVQSGPLRTRRTIPGKSLTGGATNGIECHERIQRRLHA
jgi:hypothetical protein